MRSNKPQWFPTTFHLGPFNFLLCPVCPVSYNVPCSCLGPRLPKKQLFHMTCSFCFVLSKGKWSKSECTAVKWKLSIIFLCRKYMSPLPEMLIRVFYLKMPQSQSWTGPSVPGGKPCACGPSHSQGTSIMRQQQASCSSPRNHYPWEGLQFHLLQKRIKELSTCLKAGNRELRLLTQGKPPMGSMMTLPLAQGDGDRWKIWF